MPSTDRPAGTVVGAPAGTAPAGDRPSAGQLAPLLVEAAPIIEAFTSAGHRLYLVGGIVRDLLAGRVDDLETDLDFTTDAKPPDIKEIVGPVVDALWTQGERFGTIGAKIGDRTYEITTHRAEIYSDDSRKPDVRFSDAIDEDLSRRDFTVNAMAVDVADSSLVDPYGGAADLTARILRTPLDPEISFADDPLRMLRAARFAAGYDLAPVEGLRSAMGSMADRMAIVSIERIRDELDKLLAVAAAPVGLRLLADTGLLSRLLPWADDRSDADEFIARVERVGTDPTLRLAALVADADPATVRARLRHLRYSTAKTGEVATIVAGAVALIDGGGTDAPGFRRWFARVGPLAEAARTVAPALDPAALGAVETSRRLQADLADELADLGPPLTAHQIMRELGWEPGPRIGRAMNHLTELRLDHGPLDEEAARTALRAWAATADRAD
ncbi:MAG: CCA tRNA nucleotidyltransferase [Acidimicrobiales bacterium]